MNGIKEMVDLQDIEAPNITFLPWFRKQLKGMPFLAANGSIRMKKGTRITASSVNQAYTATQATYAENVTVCEIRIDAGILVQFTGAVADELHRVRFSLLLAGWTPVFPMTYGDES